MKLQQWTLFVDMLGYRDINGSIKNDEDAKSFMDFMESNSHVFDAMNGPGIQAMYQENQEFDLYRHYEVASCFVSDSMMITFKPKEVAELRNAELALLHSANTLFIILMRLQGLIFSCFSQKGIFLRGGISNKYAHIRGHFAVGEGLIEAYKAESEIAKNPRVILHPEIQANAALLGKINFLGDEMYGGHGILQKDPDDGLLFLDYLGFVAATVDTTIDMIAAFARSRPDRFRFHQDQARIYFQRHAEALTAKLQEMNAKVDEAVDEKEKVKVQKVRDKFVWLKNYHNRIVGAHSTFAAHAID